MFAKVHPAEDVKSGNTGSCHDLVRYLEKETGEGQRFFSHTEQDISPERVIMDIDGNKKALGANDAKFFMLSLNPSQSEQMHLIGRKVDDFKELTPQEKKEVFQKLEAFTRSAMDEYALNFGRDNIRGGQDLMYYARVETERSYHPEDEEVKQGIARIGEPKPGLNLHVHVIVSRKSLDGKVKLSPGAKSAGNTWELEGRGTVKRGFSHEGWKVRVQECFNRKFDYQAKEGETYVRPQVSAEIGKITNPELKRILQDEQFTAANQIVAAMREQGYTHQVRKGVHSFSREGEVFQVEHRLLKAFEQPLSDEQLKSITERFDLTKYEANPAGYRENGLQVKDISFSTYVKDEAQKGEKALKEVAYKVVYDEQNHTTVSFATVRQFAYEHQINLVKSEPTAEAVLKKIKNPELKNLLENYRFTSANQIVVAMKEQGYTHKVRKGVHSFSREGERVSIRHKDLKKFADPKLESRHMEGIIERFNLYKYKQEGVAYRENGLEAKNISFLTYQKVPIEPEEDKSVTGKPETKEEAQQPQQETPGSEAHPEETENEAETPMPEPDPVKYRKELKEVSYDVLFDRETKTYVPISAIRKYAYENEINLIDRYKHGYAVRNEDFRECLANPEYRTVRQINKAMRERGYTIERDEAGNYTYIKGESSFFMERRDLLAFTGYAKDTGGRERERGTHRSADKTVGFIGGKAKQKLINEILGDSFRTERMLVGNVKKAVSLIQNPANIKMMLIKQIGSFLNPFKEL